MSLVGLLTLLAVLAVLSTALSATLEILQRLQRLQRLLLLRAWWLERTLRFGLAEILGPTPAQTNATPAQPNATPAQPSARIEGVLPRAWRFFGPPPTHALDLTSLWAQPRVNPLRSSWLDRLELADLIAWLNQKEQHALRKRFRALELNDPGAASTVFDPEKPPKYLEAWWAKLWTESSAIFRGQLVMLGLILSALAFCWARVSIDSVLAWSDASPREAVAFAFGAAGGGSGPLSDVRLTYLGRLKREVEKSTTSTSVRDWSLRVAFLEVPADDGKTALLDVARAAARGPSWSPESTPAMRFKEAGTRAFGKVGCDRPPLSATTGTVSGVLAAMSSDLIGARPDELVAPVCASAPDAAKCVAELRTAVSGNSGTSCAALRAWTDSLPARRLAQAPRSEPSRVGRAPERGRGRDSFRRSGGRAPHLGLVRVGATCLGRGPLLVHAPDRSRRRDPRPRVGAARTHAPSQVSDDDLPRPPRSSRFAWWCEKGGRFR